MQLVYRLSEEISQWLPLGAWQGEGLAMWCYGIVKGRHGQLSLLAEELSEFGAIETVRKRLNRWLSNERIDVTSSCEAWVRWVWAAQPADSRAILLVDETKISDRLGVLMVSLAYQQRAIPLMWRCYKANSADDYPPEGQVAMIVDMVQRVCAQLPAASRPLVMADRGISHSSALIKALQAHDILYLLRIKDDARFTIEQELSFILKTATAEGTQWVADGTLFTGQQQVSTRVQMWWGHGHHQAWCLVTNDARIPSRTYARRVWQEESFRDLKSGGWRWHTSFIRCPRRASRFVLILAVAYGWMIAIGSQQAVPTTRPPRYSVFRRGLRWVKTRLNRLEFDLIPAQLHFAPLLC